MNRTRRDLLKAGLTLSAVTAIQAPSSGLLGGEPVAATDARLIPPTPGPTSDVFGRRELAQHAEELQELFRYAKALQRQGDYKPAAVSLPFATIPMNVYMRLSEQQLAIPEPQIPGIFECFRRGWPHYTLLPDLERALAGLSHSGGKSYSQQVKELPADVPRARVASVLYMIDVDDPAFGYRTVANMLIDAVVGIENEWYRNVQLLPEPRQAYHKPLQGQVLREGFMLSLWAWRTGAGHAPHPGLATRERTA